MVLIILSGLPGAGKTTISHALASTLDAVHIRIDIIEQHLRDAGTLQGPMDDAGYRAGYALAEELLRLGRSVIADSVNPLAITRDAWRAVAERAAARALDVEVVCPDPVEHKRRIDTRVADIPGFVLPTWQEVIERRYDRWDRPHIVIDSVSQSVADGVAIVLAAIGRAPGQTALPIDIR
jgi:predicted kinase